MGTGVERLGPYDEHQAWKGGRNVSRRVPADEAVLLREDTENAKRFEPLADERAHLNIEHTLALRRARDSTRYVATEKGCRNLAAMLLQETRRPGLDRDGRVIFIGGGAAWGWENCRLTLPGPVGILDA